MPRIRLCSKTERLLRKPDLEVVLFGPEAAEALLTEYARQCSGNVGTAYGELVDYLMFKYLYSYSKASPPVLPVMKAPRIPGFPQN